MKKFTFQFYSSNYLIRPILFWLVGPLILMLFIFIFQGASIPILIKSYFITVLWLIPFIPLWLFILYFNYKKHNGNSILLVTDNYNKFIYKELNNEFVFEKSEIAKIVVYLSYPEYEKHLITAFWTEYYYVKIVLKNNTKIKITCLLCDTLIDYLDDGKIIYKKKFFPLI
ncbi:hypothetical protein [Flavobacterium sp. UBA6135]|uniref:hypothetical protein n=1 Tax=Flavobacterium sp. UBA6135 TaxID=1946553 RepID=UPI0025BA9DBF|nr:hypothetical protein [Flavobacterium sp. UBA6135]